MTSNTAPKMTSHHPGTQSRASRSTGFRAKGGLGLRTGVLGLLAMVMIVTLFPSSASAATSESSEAIRLINGERKSAGLAPLIEHAELAAAAEAQARAMAAAGTLSHSATLGSGVTGWAKLGENVGRAGSIPAVHKGFMESPGHRDNVLGSSYSHVGVGVVVKGGTVWIAEVFMESASKGTFFDDDSSVHESAIERLAGSGVTRGCDDGKFCPRDAVTRGQMAAFIQRAMGLPDAPGDTFTDDDSSVFEGAIEALADRGIVEPCGPSRYCPNDPMTREHMAVFLTRALGLPASSADRFADDDRSAWEDEIQAFAAADITRGCDTTKYCPNDSVTREQMATFLVRAFGL
jgi:uncharacterized protein YkwD